MGYALKDKIFESQIILKFLGARFPKGLNRTAKMVYGHLYLRGSMFFILLFQLKMIMHIEFHISERHKYGQYKPVLVKQNIVMD